MWFRTPPKPVDALITFLMALVFQGLVFTVRIYASIMIAKDPSLQGRQMFSQGVLAGFGLLAALLLFVIGSVKLLTVKKEEMCELKKVMLWNRVLMWVLVLLFALLFLR